MKFPMKDHSCEEQRKRKCSSSSDITSCNGNESILGTSAAPDVLLVMKELAINPSRVRNEPKVNQVLHVRKIMLDANVVVPTRKRKLRLLNKPDTNEDPGVASKKSDHRKQKKVNEDPGVTYNDVSSSVSCTYEVEAQPTEVLEGICRQKLRNRQTCCGVRPPIVKVPGRVEIFSSENSEIVVDWDSSIYKIPKQCHIPVGPHFQADIPEWTGFKKFDNDCSNVDNAGDLRWLGTRVWPMEGKNTDASFKDIGKGRTEHCSCRSTGSIDCVSQHVLEQSRKLQSELGFAFYSWRIDEMGEGITKSWATKEHKSFNSLVKKSMNSKRVNFWKQGPKCFPGKSGKDLQQCFLNVFIPRRVGLQTRLSWRSTDTDDSDNGEDVDDSKIRAKCKQENTSVKRSKYLCGAR